MSFILSIRTFLLALAAVLSTFAATVYLSARPTADIKIDPAGATLILDQRVTLNVTITSDLPANAFTGEVVFDNTRFVVENISYNTSIADLWVTEPWYNRGDNKVYFAGGTTQPGGFTGSGVLLQITLRALSAGNTALSLENIRILAHDGLGSDLSVATPIDTLFIATAASNETMIQPASKTGFLNVVSQPPALDINNDGTLSFADISVLLVNLASENLRYDFNGDNVVDWNDVTTWQQLRAQ